MIMLGGNIWRRTHGGVGIGVRVGLKITAKGNRWQG